MSLLGLDLGTTYIKAALYAFDGELIAAVRGTNEIHQTSDGISFYDPNTFWGTVVRLIEEVLRKGGESGASPVNAVGIASMAESGLLVDRTTGAARTPIYPWFEKSASAQAEVLQNSVDLSERFIKSGIRPAFKCSLARLLWLQARDPQLLDGALWLSAADYITYRLTGVFATDYSLAGRTYAFDLGAHEWDASWLGSLGIDPAIFPPVQPAGTIIGAVDAHSLSSIGGLTGASVSIAGHDHVCAAFGAAMLAGGMASGFVFDSIGTAESLVGAFPRRALGLKEFETRFSHGIHVAPGFMYWMGGISASGGSVEWLRAVLGDPPLSYQGLDDLLSDHPIEPTGILYYPYLAGSASPHTHTRVRAAFVGLDAAHTRAHLYQALLEGLAYEVEVLRRAAEAVTGLPIDRLVCGGGGAHNRHWMQIKADVSGCQVDVLAQPEIVTLGAALLAGLGVCLYQDLPDIAAQVSLGARLQAYTPDPGRHRIYKRLFEEGYMALQPPLRALSLHSPS